MQGVVDVALALCPDQERGRVHQLAAHADVALQDQRARVVYALGDVQLKDLQAGREGAERGERLGSKIHLFYAKSQL